MSELAVDKKNNHNTLVDVQSSESEKKIAINRVGVRAIRHPLMVENKEGEIQHTVGEFDMYVYLPPEQKGTHMSRFLEILNNYHKALKVHSLEDLLPSMLERLGSDEGEINIQFVFFRDKKAPVSGVSSLLDYNVQLNGVMQHGNISQRLKVTVPVTSLCPCSKEISEYGAHNQRSHIVIEAEVAEGDSNNLFIEDLIDTAEKSASCELYGILKRPDEKYVTEAAYDNPKFVEDIVREVAHRLELDERIIAYRVETENFESIHNHSAYAVIERTKQV